MAVNKCFFSGNLGADPEIKILANNKVVKFNIAVTEKYQTDAGRKENTIWISCEAWDKVGNVAELMKKGSKCHVEGKWGVERWEDESGQTKVKYILKVQKIELLDKKNEESQG